ncbi:MAG: hypothetical protein WCJ22_01420 [Actinomycetes bacterium]
MFSVATPIRRVITGLVATFLVASGFAAATPAALAVALPTDVNIRLTAADKSTMSDKSSWWTNEAASKSLVKFVEAGATLTLHYQVTDTFSRAVANVPVTLTKDGVAKASYLEFASVDTISQTTDANGYATFVLHNTTANADAEPRPVSPSTMSFWDDHRGDTVKDFSAFNFIPSIGLDNSGKIHEHIDRVWTHTVIATNLPEANIRLSAADKATMTDKSYWWTNEPQSMSFVKFVEAGTPLVLHYTATNGAGVALGNTPVTLSITADEVTTFSGSLTGTTDANGKVTFTLTSTTNVANAEPRPYGLSTMSFWDDSWNPPTPTKFEINPSVGAGVEHVDRVWTHTVKPSGLSLPVANIRLSDQDKAGMTDKTYWAPALPNTDKAFVKFVETGSDLVLHYRVTSAGGSALANTVMMLVPTNGSATFTGALTATTDADGYATFTLHSTTPNASAEPRPQPPSSMSYWDDSRVVAQESGFDLIPTVGALSERVDRVWSHTVKLAAGRPVIRLVSPVIDTTKDAYDATSWLQNADSDSKAYVRYYAAGSQLLLRYRATMSDTGAAIASQQMSLVVNGNGELTSFTAGATSIAAGSKVTLTAMTDANGYATFSLVNTNTSAQAEPAPAALNIANASWTATPAAQLGGNLTPSMGANAEAVDILFPHITKPTEVVKAGTAAAPLISAITAGNGTLSVAFTAGKAGTSATKYYGYSLDGGVTWTDNSKNTKSPLALTGLTNGVTYGIKLRAWNATGAGASSTVVAGTPVAAKPSAPKITAAVGGAGQATIAFTPGADGGAAITNYEVSTDGGKTFVAMSPTVTTSPIVVTGLGYAVKYSIAIRAVNSSGSGAASGAKDVTTTKVPQTISFTQPASMSVRSADQVLTYSTTSGLTLTVTAAAAKVCTLVGGKLHAVSAGSCTVTVAQPGNTMYAAGTSIVRKVTISN